MTDIPRQEAAQRTELREQLEDVAGRQLDLTDEELLSLTRPVVSSTYLAMNTPTDDAWVTSERLINPQPMICTDSSLLDTGGLAVTGANGQLVLRLSSFLCILRHGFNLYQEPVNILATPQGTSPVFMTMMHKFIVDPVTHWNSDVEITASAWRPDGTPAANVRFYWRCRLPASANPT